MARRLDYSARYPLHTTKEVYSALADRAYWEARMTEMRERTDSDHDIVAFESDGNGIAIELRHVLRRDQLPELAQAIQRRDMVITRRESFGPYEEETSGDYEATMPGAPGTLTGTMRLFETETGSTLRISSRAKVGIPLLGRQLEQMILINLVDLFRAEAEFTAGYLDE
jgi:hypothetical protein